MTGQAEKWCARLSAVEARCHRRWAWLAKSVNGALAAIIAGLACPSSVTAAEVTLRMKGGDLDVVGELVSFNGLKYTISAPSFGTMTFDASRFDCLGADCSRLTLAPALPPERLDPAAPGLVTVRGSALVGSGLMPSLIRGYAATLGATMTQIVGTSPGETKFRLGDAGGGELATIVIQKEAVGNAFAALQQSPDAIVISDRTIADQEAVQLGEAAARIHTPDSEHVLAEDALAVVVSPENAAVSMAEDAIANVFSGKTKDWFDLGVSGGTINIYTMAPSSEIQSVFANVILKPRGQEQTGQVHIVETEGDVADAVARDPNGIGVTSLAFLRNAKPLNLEGSCGLITKPSSFTVKSGEYPLRRRLYVYNARTLDQPAARGLLRYALSKESQAGIAANQFVDRTVETLNLEDQKGRMAYAANAPAPVFDGDQMKNLLNDVKGARRLSISFRYVAGTPDLDALSRENIARLSAVLQGPEFAGKKVMLIGFTDVAGRFQANLSLSQKRAQQIRTAVLAGSGGHVNVAGIEVRGYGPLAPVACSDTDEGVRLNRRVEVWVHD